MCVHTYVCVLYMYICIIIHYKMHIFMKVFLALNIIMGRKFELQKLIKINVIYFNIFSWFDYSYNTLDISAVAVIEEKRLVEMR